MIEGQPFFQSIDGELYSPVIHIPPQLVDLGPDWFPHKNQPRCMQQSLIWLSGLAYNLSLFLLVFFFFRSSFLSGSFQWVFCCECFNCATCNIFPFLSFLSSVKK